jgi:hypothetical protein
MGNAILQKGTTSSKTSLARLDLSDGTEPLNSVEQTVPYTEEEIVNNFESDILGYNIDTTQPKSNYIAPPPVPKDTPNANIIQFGGATDCVELHIYNLRNSYLESSYKIPYIPRYGFAGNVDSRKGTKNVAHVPQIGIKNLQVDLHEIFRNLGYVSGKFKFRLNFHTNILGTKFNPGALKSISNDRLRATVAIKNDIKLNVPVFDKFGNRYEYYLNFGKNNLARIVSFSRNIESTYKGQEIYDIVFQSKLDDSILLESECWIDRQTLDSVYKTIHIVPAPKTDPLNKLRSPDFSLGTQYGFQQSSAYKSWDSILGTNPTSSQQLINKYFSSSFNPTELNIDYRDYSNFVFYSSAVERLKNFRYKIKLIEQYDSAISAHSTYNTSSASNESVQTLNAKKNALLSGFDGYESYLYYQSSSYESSSYGEFTPSTWPKSNSTKPYQLYSYTSSQVTTWYEGQIDSASIYDTRNANSLANTVPDFIRDSDKNEPYVMFINMVGQHFDILWSYVNHLTDISSRKESLNLGIAKDLIYHVLSSLGLDATHGHKLEDLWLSSLGVNSSGSFTQTGTMESIPTDDIAKETWKRILNNLPYLLKTKGTERGIRALINCYGVPASVYRISEYSGPYQYSSDTINRNDKYRKIDKFTYATAFTTASGAYIEMPWNQINSNNIRSIELRFKAEASGSQTDKRNLIKIDNKRLFLSGSTHLVFNDGTSDIINLSGSFCNEEWWSVLLTKNATTTYNLYAIRNGNGVHLNEISGSATGTSWDSYGGGKVLRIGDNAAGYVFNSGSVQEFRLWSVGLDYETFEEHSLNPQSIVGNGTLSSYTSSTWTNTNDYVYTGAYNTLMCRYPLGTTIQDFDRTSNLTTINSIHPNLSFVVSASAVAFSGSAPENIDEIYYVWHPNLGDNLDISNKIRIESSRLDGQLSDKHSIEKSEFDSYALDSPKVGVFFSPQTEINEDIADQFSGILLDNFIGDPRDDYKDYYSELQKLRSHYNLKYSGTNSFWKYVKLVENFDASMFYLIKKFLPARSVKMVGLVIQPTVLERTKIPAKAVSYEDLAHETNVDLLPENIDSEYVTHECDVISINNELEGFFEEFSGTAVNTVGALDSNVEYVHDNLRETIYPAGKYNHSYGGCRISSADINIPSLQTYDGKPVVEVWTSNPNAYKSNLGPNGELIL